ncbi:hypothetical protein C8R43DRAFT_1130397 [Mycena crocata]|nr:hypothetical protein C8R43DRAFT_1130397 [Mycena crocata]
MSSEQTPFLTPGTLARIQAGLHWHLDQLGSLHRRIYPGRPVLSEPAWRRDRVWIKLGVAVNLLADLAGTAACCAVAHLYLVTYWGKTEAPKKRYWPVFSIGIVTAVSQTFMISRYWQMTKHHAVFGLLLVILLTAVSGIIGCGVVMVMPLDALMNIFLVLGLSASAAGNVLVSVLLFWQLCKRNDTPVTRWNFPERIVAGLIETGSFTTAVTIMGVATSSGSSQNIVFLVWIPFAFIQARIHFCTMLFLLHRRRESASDVRGNAFEAARTATQADRQPNGNYHRSSRVCPRRFPGLPPDLHNRELGFDSSSDVSCNLSNELEDIEHGGSEAGWRRPSALSTRGRSFSRDSSDMQSRRSDSPSEYPVSPAAMSPRSASPA